jgi:light-regulated signal transduction histidine kinase (bacteriophytochrome)
MFDAIMKGGSWAGELELKTKDGRVFPAYERADAIIDEKGDLVGLIGVITDITERKLAEHKIRELNASLEQRVVERTRQLEESNKELASFSYSVSHDLRAPLRGIDGFSRAIEEEYGSGLDDTGRGYLDRICSATHRMGDLIDDLRNLSMITRAEMKSETVDLSRMVRTIATELEQREPGRNVKWEIAEGLTAEGDAALLRLALDNLIGNAWKFTGKRDEALIEFGGSHQDGTDIFYIRDNGAGFDMAYGEKLFGEFQRLHTPEEFEGSGIGLATVQRVFSRHDGRIWAEGEIGRGATFYFTL